MVHLMLVDNNPDPSKANRVAQRTRHGRLWLRFSLSESNGWMWKTQVALERVPWEKLGITSYPVVTQMTGLSRHFPSTCLCSMLMENVHMNNSASQPGRWEWLQQFMQNSGLNRNIQGIRQGLRSDP